MSVGGIGGFTLFSLNTLDPPGIGPETPREQRAAEADRQADGLAEERRLEEERQARKEKERQRLDIVFLLRERLIDLADDRPAVRGSIVDIEV